MKEKFAYIELAVLLIAVPILIWNFALKNTFSLWHEWRQASELAEQPIPVIAGKRSLPDRAVENHFSKNPDLHYLNPIKQNSKLIQTHHMLDFTQLLSGYEGGTFRKEKCNGKNKWLYSFRDSVKAANEERDYLRRAKADGSTASLTGGTGEKEARAAEKSNIV